LENELIPDENIQLTKKKLHSYIFSGIIFLLISVFSILYVYHHFGGKTYLLRFDFFSLKIIVFLVLLLILYYSFDGLRLYFVLKTMKQSISFHEIMKLVFINVLFSNITPLATGGGFAQIYFLNKKNISVGTATAATTIRTTLASFFLFATTPLILIFWKIPGFSTDKTCFYVSLLIFVYFFFYFILIKKNTFLKRVIFQIFKILKKNGIISKKSFTKISKSIIKEINVFGVSFKMFTGGNKLYLFLSVLFTLFFLLTLFSFSVILLGGLGYKISFFTIIFYQIAITFFMYFTPTPGATGLAEGGYALLFSHFVNKIDIVPLLFFWRFFTIYLGMIIGLVVFYLEFFANYVKNK